ncbi:MAG: two-component regulator propeller domain-containing protein [Candidatus Pedobacter colombiensis]|uniref:histidine kinase n=1 Tax=Candidatus Pedobacter colombiensis TaxID=3121371 RepID=A0AAJ5W8T1_9SPHI|nr:hybrid sensor histidine kinase/response regulator transcription factor [Pedobacter sp.]WEK20034.1 MAG: two-component regulator propeller domain-containing protein [Pedobacter sp.]
MRVLLTVMLSCFFMRSFAQLSFDHLSVTNGLSQSTVLSICKDSRGYMWFGTRDCLNRYDGRGVKIYHSDPGDPSTISSEDYIYALLEDKKQNLWIGTQNGLNRYIPEKDAFERIPYDLKDPNSISDKIVLSMFADSKGRVWFGTNLGLSMLENAASRKFKKFFQKDGLAGNSIYAVFEDSKGGIWIGTTEGLTRMSLKNGKYTFTTFRNNPTDHRSISGNFIRTIAEDKQGRIWIGTDNDGLNLFVPETQSFLRFKYSLADTYGISNNIVRKITVSKKGELWVATMNGLNILDPHTFRFTSFKHDSDNRKSLSDNSIKDIYEDNQGSVWVGTMFGGVNVTHSNTIPFMVYKYSKYRNSISSDIISVIAGDEKENLWIGTEGQGLNYFNTKTGEFKKYVNDPRDPGSLGNNTIKAIFKDSKNRIWVGLFQGGLELFNPVTGKFKHYTHDADNPNSLSYGYVSSIAEDAEGRLLIGTSSKGLNVFDPQLERFSVISDLPGSKPRLSSSYIRLAYTDSKKNLWVGTPRGLNLLNYQSSQFKHFFKSKDKDSLRSSQINCVKEDHLHNIWIGSLRGGLSLFHPKTNSFTTYTKADGMASDNIIDILEDNEGNLWLSTDRGLTKFDKQRKFFKNYNITDGLPANEFNFNSAYKDKSGKLYFGSYNGLVTFTPRDIKENTYVPKVVFSGLKLFNKPVAINGPDHLLKEDISFTKEITFSAGQNIFTIDFLALSYIQPQRNKYAYKLEGFEKDWNYVSIPSATYTNLPSGKYRFLVKGSNNDGLWNDKPASLEIRILPPVWRTWWAYLLYFIAGTVLLYFVLRFTRRQQRLESELYYEHLNNERQQELYQMKLDFFTRISHEIRTPLTLIFAPLEKLIKLTKENNTVNQQLVGIKRNTDRLLRLISELLDFRKIETGHAKLQVSEHELVAFCRNIYDAYKSLAEIKNIDYSFSCTEPQIPVYFDVSQMEKVFYNILSNAFKYTPDGGKISFSVRLEKEQVKVVIADTGIGIPAAAQEKIFTNFYQVKSDAVTAEGWGIGLALVKNIVDLHKGEISVSSVPAINGKDGGTSLTVAILLGRAHFTDDEMLNPDVVMKAVGDISISTVAEADEERESVAGEKKYTILVVEDNDELRGFIVQSLQNTYHILEAVNGLEGWEIAITHVPDVIVSDVTMPELNGLELCIRLKKEERTNHIPVIMLTAMASQLHQVNGLEAGANIYITKPFSIQVLELSVRNILQGREELKQKYMRQVMLTPRKLETESPEEKFLNRLMLLIEENMEDPDFNVGSLVDNIGMSQTVLYKKIKAITGLSITDFIKSQRLKRAAQLLSENKLNIAEVAYSVGFNDRKYFSKEFRKQFGVAPSDYHQKTD